MGGLRYFFLDLLRYVNIGAHFYFLRSFREELASWGREQKAHHEVCAACRQEAHATFQAANQALEGKGARLEWGKIMGLVIAAGLGALGVMGAEWLRQRH